VRTKCAEKTSVGLWGQSRDPRELPDITGPSHGVVGVLQTGNGVLTIFHTKQIFEREIGTLVLFYKAWHPSPLFPFTNHG
jgi:hypothetical protein